MKNRPKINRTAAWALVLLLSGVIMLNTAWADVPKMTIDTLKEKLDDPEIVIIDSRAGTDWKSSEFKIKGAVRAAPSDFSSWASKFPKDKTLVLYCA